MYERLQRYALGRFGPQIEKRRTRPCLISTSAEQILLCPESTQAQEVKASTQPASDRAAHEVKNSQRGLFSFAGLMTLNAQPRRTRHSGTCCELSAARGLIVLGQVHEKSTQQHRICARVFTFSIQQSYLRGGLVCLLSLRIASLRVRDDASRDTWVFLS